MIEKYILYELATGRIISSGSSYKPELLAMEGQAVLKDATLHDLAGYYIADREIRAKGNPPSEFHKFDYSTKQWVDPRSLQDFKDAQWEQVKLQRSNTEFSVFKFQGVYYDCDRVSQSRIQGAVQLASIALANNQTVVQEWTTADNSVVSLNATDLINLGLQLGLFVNKVHDYGRVLRARIDAADSSLDVQKVLWDEAEFNATLQ
jgi:hypothetical protein